MVWGFSECYLRFSSQAFSLESEALTDRMVHLCNYSVQKDAEDGEGGEGGAANASTSASTDAGAKFPPISENMWPSAVFSEYVDSTYGEGAWRGIQARMRAIVLETLDASKHTLHKVGLGFEWLGFDLMATEPIESTDGSGGGIPGVYLIEVNVSPDVSHSTAVTAALAPAANADLLTLLLGKSTAKRAAELHTPYAAMRHTTDASSTHADSTRHLNHQHASVLPTPDENLSTPLSPHATALPSALPPSRLAPTHLYDYTDPHASSNAEGTDEGVGESKAGDQGGDTGVDGDSDGVGRWQLWYFEGHGEPLNGSSDGMGADTAQTNPHINQSDVSAGGVAGGAGDGGAGCDGAAADGGLVDDVATLDALAAHVPQIAPRVKEAESKAEPAADAGSGAGSYSEWAEEHHGESGSQTQVTLTASGTEDAGQPQVGEVGVVAATPPAAAPPAPPVEDDGESSSDDEL